MPIIAAIYILVGIFKRAPSFKKYYIIFTIIGTFSSVLWTYIFAQLIIDMLDSLVNLYALDATWFGAIVLGIGNS
jgi:hypothetical protein